MFNTKVNVKFDSCCSTLHPLLEIYSTMESLVEMENALFRLVDVICKFVYHKKHYFTIKEYF